MAGPYVMLTSVVACPLQVAGHELGKFSVGAVWSVARGQNDDASHPVAAQQEKRESPLKRVTQREAEIADVRDTFDPMLKMQMTAAQPAGFFGIMFGGASAKMIGAWSGSPTECAINRLLFFEDADETPTVAWWTQPLSLRDGGLIPSLTGEWVVRDNALTMRFDETTIGQPFTGGGVSTKPTDIRIRLEVVHKDAGKLLLGVPDGNMTLVAAEILDGASEKTFVRCASPS
jgi:hypothetical protein